MEHLKLKTLFICFYFPPFSRVGGRRWAKHLKYLQRFGEDFFVLAGDYDITSPWDDDIKLYQEKITRIPVSIYYPYYKRVLPKNIFQKMRWKISLWYNNYLEKNYKGNFWDDSRPYINTFLKQTEKIIQEKKIQHVCLTVGPFAYASILPELKKKYPQLKITLDFRDYWEDNLSTEIIKYESEKQSNVMQSVDLVLTPNTEMCTYYKTMYCKKTYCLPHCIDEDYMTAAKNFKALQNNSRSFTIVYGGNLYKKMESYILQLIQLIKSIQQKEFSVKLKIYTTQPSYINLFNENNINVELYEQVPTKQFIEVALNSNLLIIIRPDWSPHAFSTKFFEYAALRKPLLYIGPKGEANNFILSNHLGFILNAENVEQISSALIENISSNKIPDSSFSLHEYTFEYQTKLLINHFNNYYGNGN